MNKAIVTGSSEVRRLCIVRRTVRAHRCAGDKTVMIRRDAGKARSGHANGTPTERC